MNSIELCRTIQRAMGNLFDCTERGEYLRIRTPYLYPDGDNIDLFCQDQGDGLVVTDLAETTGWLYMQSLSSRRSPKQNHLIQDTCMTHGVEFHRGMLQARCRLDDDLAAVIIRVGQAALRVSDLWFTFRLRSMDYPVTDEVSEYLGEKQLDYIRSPRIVGRSHSTWRVDFRVRTNECSSLVYVLSTGNRSAASRITDHVVAAWFDLNHWTVGPEALHFVSLFDDTIDVWTDEDFARTEPLSTVAYWSNPDTLLDILTDPLSDVSRG